MKKTLLILLISVLIFVAFVSCSKKTENSEKAVLTVLTSPDYAPYEFYSISDDGTPTLSGFDIDLAKYIANYLEMDLEIIPMDFDGILMEVQNNDGYIGISGFSPSDERAEVVDFSKVYYAGEQSFITLKENSSKFPTLSSTNNSKYTIAAQTGSIQVGLAEKYSPKADILTLVKATDIIAELIAGKIDGAYIETAVAYSYQQNYPQIEVLHQVPYDAEGSVVIIHKGNSSLVESINKAIDSAINDGSMGKFVEKANIDASGNIYEGIIK